MVLARGLEPPQVSLYDPESYASANSATRAKLGARIQAARAAGGKGRFQEISEIDTIRESCGSRENDKLPNLENKYDAGRRFSVQLNT